MSSFSVITLVKERKKQLSNLLDSVGRSTLKPQEVVVVWMEEDRIEQDEVEGIPIRQITVPEAKLPLAEARNLGFETASEAILVFLDVDCICSPNLFDSLIERASPHTIASASVRYLNEVPENGNYLQLKDEAVEHPKREAIACDEPVDRKKFWSLAFCIHRTTFNETGGFDENFLGYGAEDTDFAERFHYKGCQLVFSPEEVLHQYHTKYSPPVNHVKSICHNANYFAQQHNYLPMYSWLEAFEEMGLVKVDSDKHTVEFVREPSDQELKETRSEQPY